MTPGPTRNSTNGADRHNLLRFFRQLGGAVIIILADLRLSRPPVHHLYLASSLLFLHPSCSALLCDRFCLPYGLRDMLVKKNASLFLWGLKKESYCVLSEDGSDSFSDDLRRAGNPPSGFDDREDDSGFDDSGDSGFEDGEVDSGFEDGEVDSGFDDGGDSSGKLRGLLWKKRHRPWQVTIRRFGHEEGNEDGSNKVAFQTRRGHTKSDDENQYMHF
ncbi:unnamed protein product [Vicia faba]|uniref:Uncharacterized protein n=1 Tax=Vicia faba TaxID=3906 RepID=A0AAV0YSV1_VICFA|nr:unnamed protein product [Vicia faba]